MVEADVAVKDKAPAYQWYPKDYDTDEAVKLMTYEGEGIYRRLLDHQWLHGGIPADVDTIARLVPKVPLTRFRKLWPSIAGKFERVGDRLVNARLERQRTVAVDFVATQSTNGRKGAEARWGNRRTDGDANSGANGGAIGSPSSKNSSSSASSSPVSPKREIEMYRAQHPGLLDDATHHRLKHILCDDTMARCVPVMVHRELCRRLAPKFGGDNESAGEALLAWYPTVWATLAPGDIIGDAFKFWQPRFDLKYATAAAPASTKRFEPSRTVVPSADESAKRRADIFGDQTRETA
jgi:uncharacterized protein YdaU (DUF1376 family)